MSLLIFLLLLISLIIVHEFGHFAVAKLLGIRVDEFSVFFPPKLFSKKWGETTYMLGALPLGGYVKIFGEDGGETETHEGNSLEAHSKANFAQRSKWVQAAVIVAGIIFNILFAWLALSAGYLVGMQTSVDHIGVGRVTDPQVTIVGVLPGSPADKAGIEANDTITRIDTGSASLPPGADADQVQQFILGHQNESMVVSIERGGQAEHLLATPQDGVTPGHKALGIELDDVGILKLSPPLALAQGAVLAEQMTVATAEGFGSLIAGALHGTASLDGVAGPIGIARIGSTAVTQGLVETIIIISLISINLAIVNLIPIPGLDGGRILFIVIEALRGKPIKEETVARITMASFIVLGILVLLISYHDILTWNSPV